MPDDPLWGQLPPGTATPTRLAFLDACGSRALSAASEPAASGAAAGPFGGFPPRHSTPTQLLVVGGVDEGWRSLK